MISVYWFVILVLVAIGVYAMISAYFSYPTDVRPWEAEILGNRIANCISKDGRIVRELNQEFEDNFLFQCNLKLDSGEWDKTQFYVEVNFYDVQNLNDAFFTIKKGEGAFGEQFSIQEGEFERIVRGSEKRFYSVDNQDKQILVEVLTVVRKTEKNVKI